MKIVADESVDYPIIIQLREFGFEILSIIENYSGLCDDEVLKIVNHKKALLITSDKDFGELTFRLKKKHHGIILLRLAGVNNIEKSKIVLNVLKLYAKELKNSFTVITKKQIRIK